MRSGLPVVYRLVAGMPAALFATGVKIDKNNQ